MSMLAEPRRKKTYVLAPRGKALYEDENSFATRMLKKMGWDKSKGLGAREDGDQDFIRIKYKNDVGGLGFQDRDDGWTQHKTEFETLLQSLNNSLENSDEEGNPPGPAGFGFQNGNSKKEDATVPKLSGESLEEKSKKSRARVHYQKFTRGKDLSQYSEKDLANIFGKKSLHANEKPQKVEEKEEDILEDDAEERVFGVQTVRTGTSINDYFKNKMALLKTRKQNDEAEKQNSSSDNELKNEELATEKSSSKKKNAKKIHEVENLENDIQLERSNSTPDLPDILKMKRKRKKQDKDTNTSEKMIPVESTAYEEINEEITAKKKKKKRKNLDEKISVEGVLESSNFFDNKQDNEIFEAKKKIKKEDKNTSEFIEDNEVSEEVCKKKSKKKNKGSKEVQDATQHTNLSQTLKEIEVIEETEKKSKKKKKRLEDENAKQESSDLAEKTSVETTEKKSKKKRKIPDDQLVNENETIPSKDATNVENVHLSEQGNVLDEGSTKQKKKRKTEKESETTTNISGSQEISTAEITSNEPKKPKKNKRSKKESTDPDLARNEPVNEDLQVTSTVSENEIETTTASLTYQINSYVAEKFRHTDINAFVGSNLSEIVGYSLCKDIALKVIKKDSDDKSISMMWQYAIREYQKQQQQQNNQELQSEAEQQKINRDGKKGWNKKRNNKRSLFRRI